MVETIAASSIGKQLPRIRSDNTSSLTSLSRRIKYDTACSLRGSSSPHHAGRVGDPKSIYALAKNDSLNHFCLLRAHSLRLDTLAFDSNSLSLCLL